MDTKTLRKCPISVLNYMMLDFRCILISNAGRAIGQMNDAAAPKAAFGNEMLHDFVIVMGINAQLRAYGFTIIHGGGKYALYGTVGPDAVDGAIGLVIEPLAVFDLSIGGVFPLNQGKDAVDPMIFVYMAIALGNVLLPAALFEDSH